MDYFAPDAEGSPILLLSHLQLNSRNVAADARAALHVREVHPTQTPLGADPLSNAPRGHPYSPFQHQQHFVDSHSVHTQSPMSSARLTLLGTVEALTDSDEIEDARARFVAAHPDAAGWAPGAPGGGGFHDFKWHKLRPTGLYWIGGFGGLHYIGWVDIALYRNASSTLIDDAN
ncbi:hypothetical protein M427DRAFT_132646 [Gonapodya prolifera JEL478]|uniref:CREG-like beta-barrel domain-containing protein n=1 Tax=Gonapodya prolifera (strain JEL478) TaxID=1344416 RepID=A0A139APY4_GONPJ|nr:hypothetical protein M427DRAFT_132646 [Gonapodya prolifera JEL478]|eukprot:KXS18714.1 hypothetical protein M427DRAFT_132646 [Gonapodya prolifera JEL478]